jgi:hypothetical protein
MAGYDNIWQAWFKGPSGAYIECSEFSTRNVIGSALASIVWDQSSYGNEIPVVIRYEVTDLVGSTATLSLKTVLLSDVGYTITTPTMNVTVGIPYEYGVIFPGTIITLDTGTRVGDIFEIGGGYHWDETTSSWISQRAFGILPQGEFGNIHTLKVKNISANDRAYVAVGWSNNGTQIITARQQNGIWKVASESPILITGVDGVPGYVAADEEFEVEFRPQVPDAASTDNNPIIIEITISGEAI